LDFARRGSHLITSLSGSSTAIFARTTGFQDFRPAQQQTSEAPLRWCADGGHLGKPFCRQREGASGRRDGDEQRGHARSEPIVLARSVLAQSALDSTLVFTTGRDEAKISFAYWHVPMS
jgi:hypothetical protein